LPAAATISARRAFHSVSRPTARSGRTARRANALFAGDWRKSRVNSTVRPASN
jgi:hypothetical protein